MHVTCAGRTRIRVKGRPYQAGGWIFSLGLPLNVPPVGSQMHFRYPFIKAASSQWQLLSGDKQITYSLWSLPFLVILLLIIVYAEKGDLSILIFVRKQSCYLWPVSVT